MNKRQARKKAKATKQKRGKRTNVHQIQDKHKKAHNYRMHDHHMYKKRNNHETQETAEEHLYEEGKDKRKKKKAQNKTKKQPKENASLSRSHLRNTAVLEATVAAVCSLRAVLVPAPRHTQQQKHMVGNKKISYEGFPPCPASRKRLKCTLL